MPSPLFLLASIPTAEAVDYRYFPEDSDWQPVTCDGVVMTDPLDDEKNAPDSRDIVGDETFPAAFVFSAEIGLFVRLRLDQNIVSMAAVEPYTWAVFFDTDGDPSTYEVTARIDGSTSTVHLFENSVSGEPGDYRDPPDVDEIVSWPFSQTVRVVQTPASTFGDDPDVFLDVRFPRNFLDQTGIFFYYPEETPISFGTSDTRSGPLSGDLVCDSPPPPPTGDTGVPVDTGDPPTFLLEGGGGCSTVPLGVVPWLLASLLVLRRREG